jgi:hypothetical protein
MFDPSASSAKKALAATKKRAQESIKAWVMELLPDEVKKDVELIACREFQVIPSLNLARVPRQL